MPVQPGTVAIRQYLRAQGVPDEMIQWDQEQGVVRVGGHTIRPTQNVSGTTYATPEALQQAISAAQRTMAPAPSAPRSPFAGPGGPGVAAQNILAMLAQAIPRVTSLASAVAPGMPFLPATVTTHESLTGRLPSGAWSFPAQQALQELALRRQALALQQQSLALQRAQAGLDDEENTRIIRTTGELANQIARGEITNPVQLVAALGAQNIPANHPNAKALENYLYAVMEGGDPMSLLQELNLAVSGQGGAPTTPEPRTRPQPLQRIGDIAMGIPPATPGLFAQVLSGGTPENPFYPTDWVNVPGLPMPAEQLIQIGRRMAQEGATRGEIGEQWKKLGVPDNHIKELMIRVEAGG